MVFERKYSDEVRDQAVTAVMERRRERPGDRSVVREVADELGVGEQSVRIWMRRQARNDRPAPVSAPNASLDDELREMRKLVRHLREENEALKRVFVVFSSQWAESNDRPHPANDEAT